MRVEMVMPQMGESIAEAKILKWLKQPGEKVNKDEIILEISTDKVDSEIPAPASGVLLQTLFGEGDVVPVKQKIAVIDTEGSGAAPTPPKAEAAQTAKPAAESSRPAPQAMQTSKPAANASSNGHAHGSDRFYSPLVKSLAEKHGIPLSELDNLSGSGHGGRVTKEDFLAYVAKRDDVKSSPVTQTVRVDIPSRMVEQPAVPAAREEAPDLSKWGDNVTIEPMSGMRQAIADHMVRSKATSPHVYSVQEVDVTAIVSWREKYKSEFQKREGFNLSFTPFFLEAAVKGLLEFPYINASVDGNKIVLKKNINLGCAVALGTSGLIVPVIKKAEEKNLVGLARSLSDLAERARSKKLLPDDVAGGSFTVTNPGVFGTVIGYPIINQPQLAILSLGAIKKRPVVINNAIAIRDICYLTLSYDHRIVDGAMGGSYVAFVRDYLENWDMAKTLY